MPAPRLSKQALQETVDAVVERDGDRRAAAKHLGIPVGTLTSRINRAKNEGIDVSETYSKKSATALDAKLISEAVDALGRYGGPSAAARALGLPLATFNNRINQADIRKDWEPVGRVGATKATARPLPKGDIVKRYILTCAQSDTKLHEPTWDTLLGMSEYLGAELLVSTYTYNHRLEGSAKRGTEHGTDSDVYDPRIEPYVVDEMVALAPSLIWNGHMNILPTAVDPLSGLDNYNGRASSILPHAKLAMKSIATMPSDAAKFQYTTGTVTLRNYIQKKAGQKAEFDHVYGALIAEVNSQGRWWVRQLASDYRGRICDFDTVYSPDGSVEFTDGSEAIVWGDVHVEQLERDMFERNWGEGGLIDIIKPRYQMMHDVLDFGRRSHHSVKDPFQMYDKHVTGRESVQAEVEDVGQFLRDSHREGTKTVVVQSNHDRHLERWLRDADWKKDPVNAEFYLKASTAYLASIKKGEYFNALKWAVSKFSKAAGVRWLTPGEPMIICRSASGGIEMGLHGDLGPNGSRGSLRNLSRLGRKVCIGHSHSCGIFNGAWQSGVTARLDMDYTAGAPSSWSQTHILVHKNGKRQLITCFEGKYRA